MNRRDLQILSKHRFQEAKLLLDAAHFSGCYYLAGYSIECAIKACIAKATQRFDFPDKQRATDSYTHDFSKLLRVAGLEKSLRDSRVQDPQLESNWIVVDAWSESSRYELRAEADARVIMQAVSQPRHGVLPWLMRRW